MELSLYERVGAQNLQLLVDHFYDLVFEDPLLKPLFVTDKNLIKQKQYMFLTQFLGGPDLYSQQYGHPRMRARHLPHPITEEHAIAWLKCMYNAVQSLPLEEEVKNELFSRFPNTAFFMVNKSD